VKDKEAALVAAQTKCESLAGEREALAVTVEEIKRLFDDTQRRRDDLRALYDQVKDQLTAAQTTCQSLEVDLKAAQEGRTLTEQKAAKEHREAMDLASKFTRQLEEKEEEITSLQAKVTEARSYKGQIFDDVKELEANLTTMQETIQTQRKQLGEKNKAIETLEYELNCMRQEGKDVEGLRETRRRNGEVIADLKEKERKLEEEIMTVSASLVQSRQDNHALASKIASLERERTALLETNEDLRSRLVDAEAEIKYFDDKLKQVRDDTIEEMMSRIISLKQDKVELESRLEELQDTIDIQKRSFFEAPSLQDELRQLEDSGGYKPSRMSVMPVNNALEKQVEQLKVEMSEKDFLVQTAQGEIETLKLETAALTKKLSEMGDVCVPLYEQITKLEEELAVSIAETSRLQERMIATEAARLTQGRGSNPALQSQVDTLQAELRRLQTELLLSKEMWADENNTLRTALMDAEKTAVEATTRYAEAAADRDSLIKKYRELTRERDRRSTKY
jgi:nucleoprotein TPR